MGRGHSPSPFSFRRRGTISVNRERYVIHVKARPRTSPPSSPGHRLAAAVPAVPQIPKGHKARGSELVRVLSLISSRTDPCLALLEKVGRWTIAPPRGKRRYWHEPDLESAGGDGCARPRRPRLFLRRRWHRPAQPQVHPRGRNGHRRPQGRGPLRHRFRHRHRREPLRAHVVNTGNATLNVKVQDVGGIPAPFSLASGAFELRPRHRRPPEEAMQPATEGTFEAPVVSTTTGREPEKRVRLTGRSLQSQLVCNPTRLDLGYVVVGESREGSFSCTNHLDVPTTITLGNFQDRHAAFFSAEIVGNGQSAEIEPGGSIDVEVTFRADNITGVATTTLPLLDPGQNTVESIHITATAVDYALQVLYEDENGQHVPLTTCFRFPETDIEEEEIGYLWVRNVSSKPVSITQIGLTSDSEVFEDREPLVDEPIPVAPNGEEEIQ